MTNEQLSRLDVMATYRGETQGARERDREAIAAIINERDALLAMLVSLEWSVITYKEDYCPSCNCGYRAGHKADCKLNTLIARAMREPTNA